MGEDFTGRPDSADQPGRRAPRVSLSTQHQYTNLRTLPLHSHQSAGLAILHHSAKCARGVENPSPGRTPCSDSAPSHRITRSLWTLESQRGNPSAHTLYDAQRCEESLTPVLETLNFRNITPSGSEQDDSSECGEDDMWRSHRTQVLSTTLYPANSGYLV